MKVVTTAHFPILVDIGRVRFSISMMYKNFRSVKRNSRGESNARARRV